MLEGWYAGDNLATKTAGELINKFAVKRHERLYNQEKEYRQCVKCSSHNRVSVHHIDDMYPVQRKIKNKHGNIREWTIYYCYKFGCAQGYKSHSERIGNTNHY